MADVSEVERCSLGLKDSISVQNRLTVVDIKKSNVLAKSSGGNVKIGASSFHCNLSSCIFLPMRRRFSSTLVQSVTKSDSEQTLLVVSKIVQSEKFSIHQESPSSLVSL